MRDRAISKKFLTPGYWQSHRAVFPKNHFMPFLAAILNFWIKHKKRIYLRTGARWSNFCEIFYPQCIHRVIWRLFTKNHFPAIFIGHLEFLHKTKQKKTHLSWKQCEIERFRQIFWPIRLSSKSTGDFSQKSFSCHFRQPS